MESKSILVGGDYQGFMDKIDSYLAQHNCGQLSVYSFVGIAELYKSITTKTTQLLILNYWNNVEVINELCRFFDLSNIYILCITTKNSELQGINNSKVVVFEETVEKATEGNFLRNLIATIFKPQQLIYSDYPDKELNEYTKSSQNQFDKSLARYSLELDQKVDTLIKVREKIVGQYGNVCDTTRKELHSIVSSIQSSVKDKRHWDDFKIYFEQVCPRFISIISNYYPSLTATDIKYCCYLKMNMSNSDISHLLGINQQSVSVHKYRLKMKMTLPKDIDLRSFVQTLQNAS